MPDKKLTWKEAWKQIWVPDWKEIWLPGKLINLLILNNKMRITTKSMILSIVNYRIPTV